jgi:hypothetical protein
LHGVRANKLTEQAMQAGRLPLTRDAQAV